MQRDRSPASYEDTEALYERRPSAWIEPLGNWGAGRVELVQIPTPDETNDNIVAFWVPEALPGVGKPLDIAYRIRWQATGTLPAGKGWVVQTRRGRGFARKPDGDINYVVDFDGPALRSLAAAADVEPVIWVDANAEVRERNLFKNAVSGAWRMTVRIKRNDAAKPVELRAYLKQQQSTLTETWSYILPAEADKP
jgi:glucans biosynthesis protein